MFGKQRRFLSLLKPSPTVMRKSLTILMSFTTSGSWTNTKKWLFMHFFLLFSHIKSSNNYLSLCIFKHLLNMVFIRKEAISKELAGRNTYMSFLILFFFFVTVVCYFSSYFSYICLPLCSLLLLSALLSPVRVPNLTKPWLEIIWIIP